MSNDTKYGLNNLNIGDNLIIYSYIRGSQSYGLALPESDTDHGFVYISPMEQLLGLGLNYQEQISSDKNDDCGYEIGKYMRLLIKSNPTILESLFIPEKYVLYEHPIMTGIKKHKSEFITKECFKPIIGYACEQIRKCRGLNKRFLHENIKRKSVLDFVYTYHEQGSVNIQTWLQRKGLKQQYCGIVNVANMRDNYALFYDWGQHFQKEEITLEKLLSPSYDNLRKGIIELKVVNTSKMEIDRAIELWYNSLKPIGYRGIINDSETSNELRLSSVEKFSKPLCYISYNKDGYSCHCVDYKNQKEWEKNRNPQRYMENKGKMFDRKNVAHCIRLLHMGIEIAKTGQFNVDRTNIDRDFILDVRLGNKSYEEIINYVENKKDEMERAMSESTLPDSVDVEMVNNLLLNARKFKIE